MTSGRMNDRVIESLGMLMIGDGVLGTLRPAEHCLMWRGGAEWWRKTMDWFAAHPDLTRAAAIAELGAGLWLALRSQPRMRIKRHEPIS